MTKADKMNRNKIEQPKNDMQTNKFITFGKTNDGKYFTQVGQGWNDNLDELLGVAVQAQEIVLPLVNRYVQQMKQQKSQAQKQPAPQPTPEQQPKPEPSSEPKPEPTKEQVEADVKKELEQKISTPTNTG